MISRTKTFLCSAKLANDPRFREDVLEGVASLHGNAAGGGGAGGAKAARVDAI